MWKGLAGRHEMVDGRLKLPGSEDTRWSGAVKLLYENIYYISNPQVLEVESREDRPPQMSQMEFLF
jgi:hypothetical protein